MLIQLHERQHCGEMTRRFLTGSGLMPCSTHRLLAYPPLSKHRLGATDTTETASLHSPPLRPCILTSPPPSPPSFPVFPIILSNRRFHRDCHGNTIGFNRLSLIPSRLLIAISDCHTDRGKGQKWQSRIFILGLSSIYNSLNKYLQDKA